MKSNELVLLKKNLGSKKVAQLLLANGADIHIKNNRGKEPRDIAVEQSEFLNFELILSTSLNALYSMQK